MRTAPWPASSSARRTFHTSSGTTPVGRKRPISCHSERSTMVLAVSSRTPHRRGPRASATSRAVRTESFSKSTSTVTLSSSAKRSANLRAASDGVAAVRGDQPVRDGAHALAAPPRRLGVGGHADRAGDVRGPAVAGLHLPVVEARGEVEDRLAAGRLDDVAHVAADQGAAREHAEVERLEVGEEAVVALDRQHRLPRLDLVAVVQGAHLQPVPPGLPRAVAGAAGPSRASGSRSPRRRRRAPSARAGRPASARRGGGRRAPAPRG